MEFRFQYRTPTTRSSFDSKSYFDLETEAGFSNHIEIRQNPILKSNLDFEIAVNLEIAA